jgi:hypothetical protein
MGFLQGAEAQADIREQAHGLRVMRVLLKKSATQGLGLENAALGDQIRSCQQGFWQGRGEVQLRLRNAGLIAAVTLKQQLYTLLITGQERWIGLYCLAIASDRQFGVAAVTGEVAELLQTPAVIGLEREERVQALPGICMLAAQTSDNGEGVQRLAVIVGLGQVGRKERLSFVEAPFPEQSLPPLGGRRGCLSQSCS